MTRRVLQEDNSPLLIESGDYLNLNVPDFNRILLETGFGLLTEASETIINDNFIVPQDVVTAAPSVSQATINQGHTLAPSNLVTGSPAVSVANMDEEETVSSEDILTGAPVVGVAEAEYNNYQLELFNILAGRPVLGKTKDPDNVTLQEIREIQKMLGGWGRSNYEVPDGRLIQAER